MTISSRTYIHYMLRNINKIRNNKSKEENNNNKYNNYLECIVCGQFLSQNEVKHNCRIRKFCNSTESSNYNSSNTNTNNTTTN
jgi:acetyl-CoA carboxylase beta subunit